MRGHLRIRCSRRLRSEIISLALAFVFPVFAFLVFPFGSIGAVPREAPHRVSCAIIDLSPEAEGAALAAARASWQMESDSVKGLRAELISSSLPDTGSAEVIPLSDRASAVTEKPVFMPSVFQSSERAPEPAAISRGETPDEDSAFSREDLLKLD